MLYFLSEFINSFSILMDAQKAIGTLCPALYPQIDTKMLTAPQEKPFTHELQLRITVPH